MRIDLHTHSLISDGTDTPAELVANAARVGLDVVALTDHDTLAGLDEARAAAPANGIKVLGGVELSCEIANRSIHLLGLGVRADCGPLNEEMARVRVGRDGRVALMAAKLQELGYDVSEADILAQAEDAASVGRPHVADVLVAKGYVADRAEAFATLIYDGGPAYVGRYQTPLTTGIALVHQAGGVSVLAHPWGRGSRDLLDVAVLASLRDAGLDAIEVNHQDHDDETRAQLGGIAAELGLIQTGSSDYHGSGKTGHGLGVNVTSVESLNAIIALIQARGGVGLS
jgi:predicted metal-dependent phosphoesterase TrpH